MLLGLECPGHNYIGAPAPDTEIRPGDTLILYGRCERVREIETRQLGTLGEHAHDAAVEEQTELGSLERSRAGRSA